MLRLEGVEGGYGQGRVLFGMDLAAEAGQVVSLIGRNGMGKTTTVRTIMGLMRPSAGAISFEGRPITRLAPNAIARLGLGLVPEGRRVFPSLTVEENLVATARPGPWTLARVAGLFPRLGERRRQSARTLSGGEQQMLAVGRALMTNPRLLILDEATEGLAPLIRAEIWRCLHELKGLGQTILVIDKNLAEMASLVDRHNIVDKGRVVWTGTPAQMAADPDLAHRYLGI
ncbi:MAG: ABC transporter ATP-binding protein [Kocuria rhizophila]|uniref:ABC transporter ATP-binding protein n=1 Tax=Paracoccus sanguinis TaxID=1545044 RepID=A0A099GJS8_9RHOB|nr:ABC transporter ATP-binding protein [Paracoccus sanguinis]KGJ14737.1 ABC transporter ATP-binding protein [Paracoccus sanguinis]KGJ23085.1 ABC transporter ATP-binding protein [Paracoccus sanguinis]PZP16909.1 MAG: ABC transporter ATP-binding protein [Kocuria rhizophila]